MILHSLPSASAYIRKSLLGTHWQDSFHNHEVTSKLNRFSGERKETGCVFK